MKSDFIKSPLNYIGGKYKILPQIFPLFPKKINQFVDLFTGGANVGINIEADTIVLNDNLFFLIDLYDLMCKKPIGEILSYIYTTIEDFDLNLTNIEGYQKLREQYNADRYPLDLLILSFFSFNHQIRFNSNMQFNIPFGKNRSRYNKNIEKNLINFVESLQNKRIIFSRKNFDDFNFSNLTANDFVYCDPPYLITVGTYNDGKRGFTGWDLDAERKLLELLDELDFNGIQFALSNVLTHKGRENELLKSWLAKRRYCIHKINNDFTHSNYHTKNKNGDKTCEVLITNY